MKLRLNLRVLSAVLVGAACTPISPSVHKSTLRPGAPVVSKPADVRPGTEIPIEARWISTEESLNSALSDDASSVVLRLSSHALSRLKNDGVVSIAVPNELSVKSPEKARVLLRVEMESEELEHALSEETWSFGWDPARANTLEIRSFYGKRSNRSLVLPEALVSVHVMLQHDTSP